MIKRIPLRAATLPLIVALSGCVDEPTGLEIPIEGPRFTTAETRPVPLQIDTTHGSHYTVDMVVKALGNRLSGSKFLSAPDPLGHHGGMEYGAHYQTAVEEIVRTEQRFPFEGRTHLVVTTGDARYVGSEWDYSNKQCADEGGVRVCDKGGIDVRLSIPSDPVKAQTLDFDFRYFSKDIDYDASPGDPFRVWLITDLGQHIAVPVLPNGGTSATVETEFAGVTKYAGKHQWSPQLRHVRYAIPAELLGTSVRMRFEVMDTNDGSLDSGALIDNLRIVSADKTAPVIESVTFSQNPVQVGTSTDITVVVADTVSGGFTGSVYQEGSGDAEYSFDGSTWTTVGTSGEFTAATAQYTITIPASDFPEPTVRTICLRGSDRVGNRSKSGAYCVELAVYDPTAGYVAGSGGIESPAGALIADPTVYGPAHFGFSSKYKSGTSTVPEGSTRFTFRTGNFQFDATAYDWLVVNGSDRAQYKGKGTISGRTGEYKFKIFTVDGGNGSTSTPDKFRIKIWSEDSSGTETVIYDNYPGGAETDVPPAITNGNIRIQK